MKKYSIVAMVVAALLVSTPAWALDAPTQPAYIYLSPCDDTCFMAGTINAATAATIDSFVIDTSPVNFDTPTKSAEFDPESAEGYFLTYSGFIYQVNVGTEGEVDLLSAVGGLPTIDAVGMGLAIDDASGVLYLLYDDPDLGHYFVVSIDRENGSLGTPLQMPTALTDSGARDFAILGDVMYVLTSDDKISTFNLSDGTALGAIDYPQLDFVDPEAIDGSAGGVLRIVGLNSDTDDAQYFSFSTVTELWSDPVTNDINHYAMAWYGAGSAGEPLAETGFDASGYALTAAALLGVGAMAFRRRARR